MTTISHKHTAKAAIRNLFAAHGASGTLQLIAEVLSESIPQRRGRPTRAEGVARLISRSLEGILPEVAAAIMSLHHQQQAAPILLAVWPDVVKAATAEAKAPPVRALVDDRREVWLIAPQWENGCIRAGLAAVGRMVSGPVVLRDVDRPLVSYSVELPSRPAAGWIEGRVLLKAAK